MGHINVIFLADDETLNTDVLEFTESSDIGIDRVESEDELFEALSAIQYNVAIIDVSSTDAVNINIIASLREKTNLGIIVVSADGSQSKRIASYERGADQFFTTPIDNLELTAAIRNLNNRLDVLMPASMPLTQTVSAPTYWILNLSSWCLVSPDEGEVKLTGKELKFLELLMSHVGENVRRKSLRKSLGYTSDDYGSRSIDSMVRRLRNKVLKELNLQLPLQTVHAVGYCFSAPAKVLGNQLRS